MISTATKSASVETAATHVAAPATHVPTTASVPAATTTMGKSGDRDECNRASGDDREECKVKMKRS
jgi:hypothetical protein